MESLVEFVGVVIRLSLDLIGYAILIRCVLGFLSMDDSKVAEVCYMLTEPLVSPVRALLNRVSFLSGSGIDFSFMATYLLLRILQLLLLSVA